MKKTTIIILCIILVMTIYGCRKGEATGEYQALIFSFSDSGNGVRHEREYHYWSDDRIDESDVSKSITITVDGVKRQATYQDDAIKRPPNPYPEYFYKDDNNCSVMVDAEGKLTSYVWGMPTNTQGTHNNLSEEGCLKIARDFLSELVDVEQYHIDTEYVSEQKRYTFKFTKYINNQKTADMATISVWETGELCSFTSTMLGKIPLTTQCNFDMDKVEQTIYEKLDSIYADAKKAYDKVEYEIVTSYATILESGEVALVAYVDVDCVRQVGQNFQSVGSKIGFVIARNE